jgi:hypothetical protein
MALAAAVALVWLAATFRHENRGCQNLTATTLWQFFGCVACYFIGAFLFGSDRALRWLLIGVLAAFTFCLVRAVDQRLFEFPQSHQMLIEGERANWTNLPPEMFLEMKRENIIITTNGMDVANPVILAKFAKGRVNGTLVYPNALAGAVLLLFPVSLVLAFNSAKRLRPAIRAAVIALAFFWAARHFSGPDQNSAGSSPWRSAAIFVPVKMAGAIEMGG